MKTNSSSRTTTTSSAWSSDPPPQEQQQQHEALQRRLVQNYQKLQHLYLLPEDPNPPNNNNNPNSNPGSNSHSHKHSHSHTRRTQHEWIINTAVRNLNRTVAQSVGNTPPHHPEAVPEAATGFDPPPPGAVEFNFAEFSAKVRATVQQEKQQSTAAAEEAASASSSSSQSSSSSMAALTTLAGVRAPVAATAIATATIPHEQDVQENEEKEEEEHIDDDNTEEETLASSTEDEDKFIPSVIRDNNQTNNNNSNSKNKNSHSHTPHRNHQRNENKENGRDEEEEEEGRSEHQTRRYYSVTVTTTDTVGCDFAVHKATGRIVVQAVHARKNQDHGISRRDVLVAINNTKVTHLMAANKKPRTNEIVQHLNSITKKKARFYLGGNTVGTEFRPLYVVVHQALTFRFSSTTTTTVTTTRPPSSHHTPNPNPKHETSRSTTTSSSSNKHLKQKKKRKTKTVPVASSLPYKHRQRQQQGALYQNNNNNNNNNNSDQYDIIDDNKDNDNITAATRSAITATTRGKWSAWEHDQFVEALKASNNLDFDRKGSMDYYFDWIATEYLPNRTGSMIRTYYDNNRYKKQVYTGAMTPRTRETEVSTAGPYDVIFGWDSVAVNYPGNQRFRRIMKRQVQRICRENHGKEDDPMNMTVILQSLMDTVSKQDGARFLKKQDAHCPATEQLPTAPGSRCRPTINRDPQPWFTVLSDQQAREEIGRAVRDYIRIQTQQHLIVGSAVASSHGGVSPSLVALVLRNADVSDDEDKNKGHHNGKKRSCGMNKKRQYQHTNFANRKQRPKTDFTYDAEDDQSNTNYFTVLNESKINDKEVPPKRHHQNDGSHDGCDDNNYYNNENNDTDDDDDDNELLI